MVVVFCFLFFVLILLLFFLILCHSCVRCCLIGNHRHVFYHSSNQNNRINHSQHKSRPERFKPDKRHAAHLTARAIAALLAHYPQNQYRHGRQQQIVHHSQDYAAQERVIDANWEAKVHTPEATAAAFVMWIDFLRRLAE